MCLYDLRALGKGPLVPFPGYHNTYKRLPVVMAGPGEESVWVACSSCPSGLHAWDVSTQASLGVHVPTPAPLTALAVWEHGGDVVARMASPRHAGWAHL